MSSEELLQTTPFWIGRYSYYRLGSTTLSQLKKAKIISGFHKSLSDKKPDGLITLQGGIVKAVIEYKPSHELNTDKKIQAAIDQEIEVAKSLCKLLIVTDGLKSYWINALNGERITKGGKNISFVFDANSIVSGSITIEKRIDLENLIDQADYSLSDTENEIKEPAILDPSPLAKEVWQKIWINTGKEPEKCLYNVVEIFVFKFLSDISVLNATNNFNFIYHIKESQNAEEALKAYSNMSRKHIKDMFPVGADGTTIFNGTIFVSETGDANLSQANLFSQVLDSFQKYDEKNGSFRYVTKEFKTRLYETFLRQSAGVKNLGQFFTPRNVVQAMVKMSSASTLNAGARICDPFCGVGGFLLETIAMCGNISDQFKPVNGVIKPNITLLGFDKGTDEKDDERTIILAKANMLIYFSDLLAQYHSKEHLESFSNNAFNQVFHLIKTNLGTFGKVDEEPFDLILTNPPYVTSGSSSLKEAIEYDKNLQSYSRNHGNKPYYVANGRGTQSLAIEWIINNLKKGGEALVVVPDSLLLQETMLNFMKQYCQIRAIISLPLRTFYSTSQKTYILIFSKKNEIDEVQSDVFTYLVSEIGETRDSKRFTLSRNDLTEAVQLFSLHKNNLLTGVFPRCKVLTGPNFNSMDNWLIDRLWSIEEKKELGISDEKESMTEEDFWGVLEDVRSYLNEIVEGKKCEY